MDIPVDIQSNISWDDRCLDGMFLGVQSYRTSGGVTGYLPKNWLTVTCFFSVWCCLVFFVSLIGWFFYLGLSWEISSVFCFTWVFASHPMFSDDMRSGWIERQNPDFPLEFTPWKMNGWNLKITWFVSRKIIWTKPARYHPCIYLPTCSCFF